MIINRKDKFSIALPWTILVGILIIISVNDEQLPRYKKTVTVNTGYLQSTSNQEMIDNLKKKLASNPDDFSALVDIGHIYSDMMPPERAIEYFSRAEKLKPNDAHVLTDLGSLYSKQGNFVQAVTKFQAAYDSDPTYLENLYYIAQTYLNEIHNIEKATELLNYILTQSPDEELRKAVLSAIGNLNPKDDFNQPLPISKH